jgi:hypothetical protein
MSRLLARAATLRLRFREELDFLSHVRADHPHTGVVHVIHRRRLTIRKPMDLELLLCLTVGSSETRDCTRKGREMTLPKVLVIINRGVIPSSPKQARNAIE